MSPGPLAGRRPVDWVVPERFAGGREAAAREPPDFAGVRGDADPERDEPDRPAVDRPPEPLRPPVDRADLRAPPDEPEAERERDEVGVFVAMASSLTRGADIAARLAGVSAGAMPR